MPPRSCTLAEWIGLAALKTARYWRPFVGEQVRFIPYLNSHFAAVHGSSLIAFSLRRHPHFIGLLLAEPGHEPQFLESLRTFTAQRIAACPTDPTAQLGALTFDGELNRIRARWCDQGVPNDQIARWLQRLKWPMATALGNLALASHLGFGVGIFFPQLVEAAISRTLTDPDRALLGEADDFQLPDLQAEVEIARSQCAAYLAAHRPELIPQFHAAWQPSALAAAR